MLKKTLKVKVSAEQEDWTIVNKIDTQRESLGTKKRKKQLYRFSILDRKTTTKWQDHVKRLIFHISYEMRRKNENF